MNIPFNQFWFHAGTMCSNEIGLHSETILDSIVNIIAFMIIQ